MYVFPTLYPMNSDNANNTLRKILLVLLATMITSGMQVMEGTVDPTNGPANPAPANLNIPAIYINTITGTIFTWNVADQVWN